jgi:hypothetical protein
MVMIGGILDSILHNIHQGHRSLILVAQMFLKLNRTHQLLRSLKDKDLPFIHLAISKMTFHPCTIPAGYHTKELALKLAI